MSRLHLVLWTVTTSHDGTRNTVSWNHQYTLRTAESGFPVRPRSAISRVPLRINFRQQLLNDKRLIARQVLSMHEVVNSLLQARRQTVFVVSRPPIHAQCLTMCALYIFVLLVGRVALVAQRPIVIKLSRGRSVGRCVGLSVRASDCPVYRGKRRIGSGCRLTSLVGRVQRWGR